MGLQTKEVGGGAATGLANDWIHGLQALLNGGGLGTASGPDAVGSTGNIMGILSDLLSGGAGKPGAAISEMISKQQTRDVNALRSRFGVGGGTAFGTPGQYSESLYRAEAAPQITNAVTGLQLQAIMPLLSAITGLSGRGISQRQVVQQQSDLGAGLGIFADLAKTAAPFFLPGIGTKKDKIPPAPIAGPDITGGFTGFVPPEAYQ